MVETRRREATHGTGQGVNGSNGSVHHRPVHPQGAGSLKIRKSPVVRSQTQSPVRPNEVTGHEAKDGEGCHE